MQVQIWKCSHCSTERVWGNVTRPPSEVCPVCDETLLVLPVMLICDNCRVTKFGSHSTKIIATRHTFERMEGRVYLSEQKTDLVLGARAKVMPASRYFPECNCNHCWKHRGEQLVHGEFMSEGHMFFVNRERAVPEDLRNKQEAMKKRYKKKLDTRGVLRHTEQVM